MVLTIETIDVIMELTIFSIKIYIYIPYIIQLKLNGDAYNLLGYVYLPEGQSTGILQECNSYTNDW